ncbi:organic cation transporter protein isoform X2 [Parasteatoda tepidariorum]
MVPSRCSMYEVKMVDDEFVLNVNKTIPCSAWEYDNSFYINTLTQEYDLVCDRDWLISYTQSNYMAGMMCGVFLFGHLADRFGRQIILNVSVTLMLVASIITAFAPNFTFFSVTRFLLALGVGGTQNTSFCLLMEVIGPIYRTRVTFAFSFGWCFGLLLLPGMTYLIREWQYQQLASAAVSSILLSYWIFMPESPRWLMTQGKYEKAEKVMRSACKRNRLKTNNMPVMMKQLKERIERDERKENPNIIDLFRTSNLRKNTLFVFISYFSVAFVFYGLSLGQTTLAGNPFLNFFIGSAVELPAYFLCMLFIRYLKRKPSFLIFDIIGGLACFLMIDLGHEWLRITAAMVGKLCISGAFIILAIHAAEIFPTVVRTVGSGTSLMMGRIGASVAPFVKELGIAIGKPDEAPAIVFGSLSFLAALMIILLPETYNQCLPDTICEAEELGSGFNLAQKIDSDDPEEINEENDIKLSMLNNGKDCNA